MITLQPMDRQMCHAFYREFENDRRWGIIMNFIMILLGQMPILTATRPRIGFCLPSRWMAGSSANVS